MRLNYLNFQYIEKKKSEGNIGLHSSGFPCSTYILKKKKPRDKITLNDFFFTFFQKKNTT